MESFIKPRHFFILGGEKENRSGRGKGCIVFTYVQTSNFAPRFKKLKPTTR